MAISAVLFAVLLPIHGQEKAPHTQSQKDVSRDPHNPESPRPTTVWNVINQETTEGQSNNPKEHPKSYLARLFSAENLPNIGLCFVGAIGIGTAVSTLKKIERQTKATETNLILQFRPKVIIRGGFVVGADRVEEATMDFVVTNIGASKAHVEQTKLVAKLADYSSPACKLFEKSFIIPAVTLDPGHGVLHTFTMDKETTAAIRHEDFRYRKGSAVGSAKTIIFAGTLKYSDDADVLRKTGVFRKYSPAETRFIPQNDPDYEYAD